MASTYAMIKPTAIQHTTAILGDVLRNGFKIAKLETRQLTPQEVAALYEEHKGKDFYSDLTEYILSGEVVIMMLERNKASDIWPTNRALFEVWRKLIGPTDTHVAPVGTLRYKYGNRKIYRENALHGSDSVECAERELKIFWPISE